MARGGEVETRRLEPLGEPRPAAAQGVAVEALEVAGGGRHLAPVRTKATLASVAESGATPQ